MKRTFILAILGIMGLIIPSKAALVQNDSLIIQFANRTKLIIYSPDKAGIQSLSKYDLNKIVREMGMKLDSIPNGPTAISIDSRDGERYVRDTVIVITKKGKEGKDGITITINRGNRTDSTSQINQSQSKKGRQSARVNNWGLHTDILLGLNTLLTQSTNAGYSSDRYELRPIGSRFLGVSINQRPTLIRGKTARLSLQYGLEVNWNNFMFDNPVTVTKGQEKLVFNDIKQPSQKSKLTIANLQLPVVPRVSFYNRDGRKVAHLGVGGYVGYRIDSYTMIKYSRSEKVRDHDRFYQNDIRYGVMAHLGLLRTNFFVKYDLTPVFKTAKGPDVRALSFGITL